jgi:hypothetical protein
MKLQLSKKTIKWKDKYFEKGSEFKSVVAEFLLITKSTVVFTRPLILLLLSFNQVSKYTICFIIGPAEKYNLARSMAVAVGGANENAQSPSITTV